MIEYSLCIMQIYVHVYVCPSICAYTLVSRDTFIAPKGTGSPWVLGLADFARLGGHQAARAPTFL